MKAPKGILFLRHAQTFDHGVNMDEKVVSHVMTSGRHTNVKQLIVNQLKWPASTNMSYNRYFFILLYK